MNMTMAQGSMSMKYSGKRVGECTEGRGQGRGQTR
jgi:hypothetical protein